VEIALLGNLDLMRNIVTLIGRLGAERQLFNTLAAEFGWSFENVRDLGELRQLSSEENLIAVLFEPNYNELKAIQRIAPAAFPIVCHRLSKPVCWSAWAEAGAFHALLLPFQAGEVRQSLAFVHAEERRRRSAADPLRRAPGIERRLTAECAA
jgi:hypothetical protein